MTNDIAFKVSSLRITAEEYRIIALDDVLETNDRSNFDLMLVGKVMTVRTFNFEAQKRTLDQIWLIAKAALFRKIENGLFVVQFANQCDKNKVLAGRPWTFDQLLVMLQEIDDDIQPSNIGLKLCPFWVRLYNFSM